METLCFTCKNAYAHKCEWIRFAGVYKEHEELITLINSLGAKYIVTETAEGNVYKILYCKNFIKEEGGKKNERRSKKRRSKRRSKKSKKGR